MAQINIVIRQFLHSSGIHISENVKGFRQSYLAEDYCNHLNRTRTAEELQCDVEFFVDTIELGDEYG